MHHKILSLPLKSVLVLLLLAHGPAYLQERPNFLIVVAEDLSWSHFSTYGNQAITTPAFDGLANSGILFERAYCPAPSCGPSRSSILTGRPIWQLGPAASIYTPLPPEYITYPDVLEANGYAIGYAGKGWGPGSFTGYGRTRNPAGPRFQKEDYKQSLDDFLQRVPSERPFSFWIGTSDAHRPFEKDKYLEYAIDLSKINVPKFLPDNLETRKEIADYLVEVKNFDKTLGQLINILKSHKKYGNTVLIVTADHGWSFPRGKGSLYEYGMHIPLVIHFPRRIARGKRIKALVNLNELAPTILELAGVEKPEGITTKGFTSLLIDDDTPATPANKEYVFLGHERHSPYRPNGLGYPMRGIRTERYYFIENFKPSRWPAGAPPRYADPSDETMTKSQIVSQKELPGYEMYYRLCYDKRPTEELYDMEEDPYQLNNLAYINTYRNIKLSLKKRLGEHLLRTNDPRYFDAQTYWDRMPWMVKWKFPEYRPRNHGELVKEFDKKYKKGEE